MFAPTAYAERITAIASVGLEEGIRTWLMLLADVLSPRDQPTKEVVALACRKVANWAEERSFPRTAIWYAQAAALSCAENAEHAFAVAVACRKNSEYNRADAWYRRAIGLARRKHDAFTYTRAYMGLGSLFIKRHEHQKAKQALERAYRTARRAGIRELRAEALHDLFMVAAETHQVAEAEVYAGKAHRAYHRTHANRVTLAHDVAAFWVLQGHYGRALPVLEAVTKVLSRPASQLFALSNLARAAGATGRVDVFARAWVETWQIIDHQPELDCVTSSLLRLAYGSASLGDWERVELAAGFAFDLATKRGEEDVRLEAGTLLKALNMRQVAEPVPSLIAEPQTADAADLLAEEMVKSLAACAAGHSDPRMQC
ncbi:MAG TPA: hypothetical protein VF263_21315 [Longimicrobiaceae bacterium]